jgi:bifunctional UDP-N-acetylglucosamine pyrophosphorylase/glucosamine-1-phosphate N-acetyltransferase
MSKLNIIILAAGKGTRMHSSLPKVLLRVGGKPILGHVIVWAKSLEPQ